MEKEYIFENNLVNIGLICRRFKYHWKLIVLSGLIFSSLAFVFARVFFKPVWISSAIVNEPKYSQLSAIRTEVIPLINMDSSIKTVLSNYTSSDWLIEQFILQYNRYDTKLNYIKNNKKLFGITDGANENIQIKNALDRLNFKKISNEKNIFELTASASSSEDSYNILNGYIELVNFNVISEITKNLNILVRNEKELLINKAENAYNEGSILLEEFKEKNKIALRLAKSAKIEYPKENLNEVDKEFAFSIGSKALEEKAKILNTIKNISLFNPQIGVLKNKIEIVNNIKIREQLDINIYGVIKSPSLPLTPEKNKTPIVILLGAIFGFIFGMVMAILKNK
ncbi:TPA: hypothetical protein ACX6QC_003840 [Photobacterium damselae]